MVIVISNEFRLHREMNIMFFFIDTVAVPPMGFTLKLIIICEKTNDSNGKLVLFVSIVNRDSCDSVVVDGRWRRRRWSKCKYFP